MDNSFLRSPHFTKPNYRSRKGLLIFWILCVAAGYVNTCLFDKNLFAGLSLQVVRVVIDSYTN